MFNQPDAATDRPYPGRTEKLPEVVEQVDAAWLTRLLQNRYPGVVVESMEVVKLINTHTTKLRLALELNKAGRDAGIPKNVCIKSNWSGKFRNVDISELEARFHYFVRDALNIPAPISYYADWDPEVGEGVVVMEDLALRDGQSEVSQGSIRAVANRSALPGARRLSSRQQLPARQRRARRARLAARAQRPTVARPHLFHDRFEALES